MKFKLSTLGAEKHKVNRSNHDLYLTLKFSLKVAESTSLATDIAGYNEGRISYFY